MKNVFTYGLFLALVLFTAGCKKSKTIAPEDTKVSAQLEIVSAKDAYQPMELVEARLKDVIVGNSEVIGLIDKNEVKIALVNNAALFLVPDLAPGNYKVVFSVQNQGFVIDIKIVASLATNAPLNYDEQISQSIDSSIVQLTAYSTKDDFSTDLRANAAADASKFSDLAQFYKAEFNKLTPAERQIFTKVVAANLYWIKEIRTSLASLKQAEQNSASFNGKMLAANEFVDHEARQSELIDKWLKSFYPLTRNIAKLTALVLVMPVTGSIPIVGTIGTGIALGYMFTEVCASLSENLYLMENVLSAALIPYQDLTFSGAVSEIFNNGQQKVFTATASFRNLIANDDNSTSIGSKIKEFLTSYNSFKSSVGELLGKLPERFKPNVVISNLKTAITSTVRAISSKYLSVTNVSNPKVTVSFTRLADGTLAIKATTTEDKDQEFSYDLVYNHLLFGALGLKKTIKATVKGDYSYKLEFVSGSGQIYTGGGMPNPMVFRVKNIGQNTYVSTVLPSNLTLTATADLGYQDAAFIANGEYCGSSQCFGGYYYVPSNANKPDYKLYITVTLRKNGVTIDTYNVVQDIRGKI